MNFSTDAALGLDGGPHLVEEGMRCTVAQLFGVELLAQSA